MTTRRISAGMVAIAVTLAVTAGAAFAGKPIKGAVYTGKIKRTATVSLAISFKVSKDGKKVSGFTFALGYPVYCQGAGFGSPQPASAKISRKGKFTAKLPLIFAPTHQHQGFLIVTGAFGKHGRESGKVKTAFTLSSHCNGTSSYSTTG